MEPRRDSHELRAAEVHRRIAARLREDPSLVAETRARLEAVIARDPDAVLVEWRDALLMLDANQLADFIESTTPKARRLRISSPLVWIVA